MMSSKIPNIRLQIDRWVLWSRENLFNNRLNSILTVVMTAIFVAFAFFVIRYVLFDAQWIGVTDNLRLLFVGSYPLDAEIRLWIPFALAATVLALAFGIWASVRTYTTIVVASAFLFLILGFDFIPSWLNALSFGLALPFETTTFNFDTNMEETGVSGTWLGVAAIFVGSYAVFWAPRISVFKGRSLRSMRDNPIILQSILLAVAIVILVAVLLQYGLLPGQGGIEVFPSQWGGVFIDILVFSVGGGIIMFPLGLLLALARTSRYPVISYSVSLYIEIIRAGPLVVWLVFAEILWDDFLFFVPEFPIRAMLVFGFFGAAYIAEVVRGGLQSIPKGQYEAAFSLNLTTITTYTRIILPQAIRAVIPAIIGRFISIWKDTSLLVALGVTNLLNAGRAALTINFNNIQYLIEIYLVIAIIYWMVSYAFSRFGRHTEKQLGL